MPRGSAALRLVDDAEFGKIIRFNNLEELEGIADQLPTEFLRCRDLGHNFQPYTVRRYRNAYEERLRCPRCKTKKIRTIGSRGLFLGSPRYEYPEGYLIKGQGNLSADARGIIRLNSVLRTARIIEVDEEL